MTQIITRGLSEVSSSVSLLQFFSKQETSASAYCNLESPTNRRESAHWHRSPGFYLFKGTMEKGRRERRRGGGAETLAVSGNPLEINASSLIMATHAAPPVRGVTRAGWGIFPELISLSTHKSCARPGQLALALVEGVQMRTNFSTRPPARLPTPGAPTTGGLAPVYVPFPQGSFFVSK